MSLLLNSETECGKYRRSLVGHGFSQYQRKVVESLHNARHTDMQATSTHQFERVPFCCHK
jgi:hypothetical protein